MLAPTQPPKRAMLLTLNMQFLVLGYLLVAVLGLSLSLCVCNTIFLILGELTVVIC